MQRRPERVNGALGFILGIIEWGEDSLVPLERETRVLPHTGAEKMEGAFTSYHSLVAKASMIFFLDPFLPLVRRLFLLQRDARGQSTPRAQGVQWAKGAEGPQEKEGQLRKRLGKKETDYQGEAHVTCHL